MSGWVKEGENMVFMVRAPSNWMRLAVRPYGGAIGAVTEFGAYFQLGGCGNTFGHETEDAAKASAWGHMKKALQIFQTELERLEKEGGE